MNGDGDTANLTWLHCWILYSYEVCQESMIQFPPILLRRKRHTTSCSGCLGTPIAVQIISNMRLAEFEVWNWNARMELIDWMTLGLLFHFEYGFTWFINSEYNINTSGPHFLLPVLTKLASFLSKLCEHGIQIILFMFDQFLVFSGMEDTLNLNLLNEKSYKLCQINLPISDKIWYTTRPLIITGPRYGVATPSSSNTSFQQFSWTYFYVFVFSIIIINKNVQRKNLQTFWFDLFSKTQQRQKKLISRKLIAYHCQIYCTREKHQRRP